MSLFNQRLFRARIEDRLSMSPAENTRWLEIIQTATKHRKLREEAVIAATRRMTDIYPIRNNNNPAHRPEKGKSQEVNPRGARTKQKRRDKEQEREKEEE